MVFEPLTGAMWKTLYFIRLSFHGHHFYSQFSLSTASELLLVTRSNDNHSPGGG